MNDTPSTKSVTMVQAALEAVDSSWILAVGDPADASKAGVHRLAPRDVDGLLGRLGQARGGRSGRPAAVVAA